MSYLSKFASLAVSCFLAFQPADAAIEHVIAISVDGLRGDYVQGFVTANPADFPTFVRLQNTGAYTYNARCDFTISETVPNHLSMITGRPVEQPAGFADTWHHGFSSNFPTPTDSVHALGNPAVPYKTSVFDVVHDRGLSTAIYYGKSRLHILAVSYDGTNGASDSIAPDNGRGKIDYVLFSSTTTQLLSNLTQHIQGNLERFTFLHITDPDSTGHNSGWSATVNGPYYNAIKTLDQRLGAILNTIDARPALAGKVAVVITGDHGGGAGPAANAHTDATQLGNCVIPFFLVAPGIPAGSDLYTIFANRVNPGTTLPSYTVAAQPIRNGDLANLSLALLGLPPISGALLVPELKYALASTQVANGDVKLSWPRYLTGWQLQSTNDLVDGEWSTVPEVSEVNGNFEHTVVSPEGARFFRLKRP